jgi:hypothetical protein
LLDVLSSDEIQQRVGQFSSVGEFTITKVGKGKTRTRDLKQWVTGLDVSESVLRLTLKADQAGSVHSLDAVEAILGLNRVSTRTMKIVKTSVTYDTSK